MKFLILLAYYKRPKMVLNALQSINELEYNDFELVFMDDSGDSNFHSTLQNTLTPEVLIKTTYHPILEDDFTKRRLGGSCHGRIMNYHIKNRKSDIVIVLCDDDALMPDYLSHLNVFYIANPDINYAYSYVKYYDPSTQHYKEASEIPKYFHHGSTYTLNNNTTPVAPVCSVDSSQVTFRTKCFIDGINWPERQTRGLDAAVFQQFHDKYGLCYPTKVFGQYKGAFPDQMGNRGVEFNLKIK